MKKLLLGLLASILLIGNLAFAAVAPIGAIVTNKEQVIVQKVEDKPVWTGNIEVSVNDSAKSGAHGSIGINRSVDDGEHVLKPSTI
jgi:hypothetical protein